MKPYSILILALLLFGTSTTTVAVTVATGSAEHPVSVVEADIYVNRFQTTMKLKCFAEDLELLQGVEALEDGFYDSEELLDATQDHAEYLAEKLTIRNAAGELIPAKVTEVVDIEIPEEGIRAGTLMKYQMGFELEFEYDEPPEFITIEQKMIADGALLPSELKILLKQAGSDTPYLHMMKPEQPETFRFDWDKPILSKEASEKEWEEWFEEQRTKTLGITSYSSVYSFIYITDYEVRHEVLIPLATLSTLMEFERVDESFLDIAEQESAAEKIKAFFSVGNPVVIDSIEVQPVFDRIDFYGLDLRDFAVQAEKRKISMANGRVGVIMSYNTKSPPTSVEVSWDKFNDVIKSVDSVVFAYDKIEKTQFSMFLENNTFRWEEPDREPLPPITGVGSTIDLESFQPKTWSVPVVSLGLLAASLITLFAVFTFGLGLRPAIFMAAIFAAAAVATLPFYRIEVDDPFAEVPVFQIADEKATKVFEQLHSNMFRAFDYRHEADVYDALANSVDGNLLRNLYLQINKSLKVQEQGGAIARIEEVNLLEGTPESANGLPLTEPGFGFRCKWNLVGTIEHWGHIHQRTNQYDAQFLVQLKGDAWKITSMQVLDEEQGQVKTSLRKF